ncbi:MAG: hypothetical protein BWY26_01655 [Elusimicrobia bacterium ADurb.Bin231]|nr:MAG: hypothetical protein BWY26_01655 [Elusimicrobia bacterium ADurb.Bin231]
MPKKSFNPILFVGLLGTCIAGTSFIMSMYSVFSGDRGIWWTPMGMKVTLDKTRNEFELYIADESLQQHLDSGVLFLMDNNEKQYRVVSEDIVVRLNNWNKVKADMLLYTTATGCVFGISITLLAVGLFEVLVNRKKVVAH